MTTENPLTCKELADLVTEYLEGKLSPADQQRFEEHMDMCPPCRIYVDQINQTITLTGALKEDDIPVHIQDALLDAFRAWKRV